MSNSLLIKTTLVMLVLGLMFFVVACNTDSITQNATPTISPTAETTTWTPPLILSPITPPEGSVALPGGVKVIPSVESPWPDLPVYEDVYKYAEIKTGDEFSIGLDAYFQLGVSWTTDYDENILSLVAEEIAYYGQGQRLGTQWFRFKAISEGIVAITFDLTSTRMNGEVVMHLPFIIVVIN